MSAEFLTSAARTDFVERALLASHLAPSRDWGGMVQGEPRRWLLYQVGVFKGDARTRHDRAGTTGVCRLVLTPMRGFDVGGSFSRGEVRADLAGPGLEPAPKGALGEGPSGVTFYERHFVDGRRQRLGLEGSIRHGPARLTGEWMRMREQRKGQGSVLDDLPDQVARGWSTAATCLITGEKKDANIKPRRPLPHGPGAIELGVRMEAIHFDDDGPDTGFEGLGNRARNIRPAGDRIFTGGVSWWPVAWLRLMGNVLVERYEDALLAPEPGREGNYVTLLGRVQVQLR
jgi:phosphate-selective porin